MRHEHCPITVVARMQVAKRVFVWMTFMQQLNSARRKAHRPVPSIESKSRGAEAFNVWCKEQQIEWSAGLGFCEECAGFTPPPN